MPTQSEKDGFAMSTRNQYLSDLDRERAPQFYRLLCYVRDSILIGNSLTDAKKRCSRNAQSKL